MPTNLRRTTPPRLAAPGPTRPNIDPARRPAPGRGILDAILGMGGAGGRPPIAMDPGTMTSGIGGLLGRPGAVGGGFRPGPGGAIGGLLGMGPKPQPRPSGFPGFGPIVGGAFPGMPGGGGGGPMPFAPGAGVPMPRPGLPTPQIPGQPGTVGGPFHGAPMPGGPPPIRRLPMGGAPAAPAAPPPVRRPFPPGMTVNGRRAPVY
jgi:hypothetical protein